MDSFVRDSVLKDSNLLNKTERKSHPADDVAVNMQVPSSPIIKIEHQRHIEQKEEEIDLVSFL